MENNFNIEDLFKNTLENAEATPPAGAWEAIQAKMGVTAASTAAGTAATGLGMGKIAAIVVTALGIGLGAGYLAFKDGKTREKGNSVQTEKINPNNTPVTLPENVEITELSSVRTSDKIVQEVEVIQSGHETTTIRMKVSKPLPANEITGRHNSIVNQWLSPSKDKAAQQEMLKRIMNELAKAENPEPAIENLPQKENPATAQKENARENVEAVIVSVINQDNPLKVSFSNYTPASRYEWDFGDGNTSTEANPVHTYTQPGFYPVSLKVYDKAGKTYTNKDGVDLREKKEEPAKTKTEESFIGKPNTFTPNGDGLNDLFFIPGKNITSFTLQIIDKNNKTVFAANSIDQRWDGTDKNGLQVPAGKYYYSCKAVGTDGKLHQDAGVVIINR